MTFEVFEFPFSTSPTSSILASSLEVEKARDSRPLETFIMCALPPNWEIHADLQHQPIVFRSANIKKPQYNFTPYNNANPHPEEWTPEQELQDSDDDGEMFSLTGFSPADSNHIPIQNHQLRKSVPRPLVGEIKRIYDLESHQLNTRLEHFTCSAALQRRFSSYRPVLVHDSSGWHALAFSYFEILLYSRSKAEVDGEIARILSLNNLLKTTGQYEIGLIEDMINETVNLLKDLLIFKESSLKTASVLLLRRFNDPGVSDAIICHLRLIASSWLVAKPTAYEPYIPEGLAIETYRNRWLNAPHQEIDALGMTLLVDVLLRPLNGVEFDVTRIGEDETTTHCIYPTISAGLDGKDSSTCNNSIHLLYRSNHYDILYREDRTREEGKENNASNLPPSAIHPVTRAEFEGNVTCSTESFEESYQVSNPSSFRSVTTLAPKQLDTVSLLGDLCLSENGMDSILGVDLLNCPIHAWTAATRETFEPQDVSLDLIGLSNIVGFAEVQARRNSISRGQQSRPKETESTATCINIASAKVSGPAAGDSTLSRGCTTDAEGSQPKHDGKLPPNTERPIIQRALPKIATSSPVKESLDSYGWSDDDCEIDWEEEEEAHDKEETRTFSQDGSILTWSHSSGRSTVKSILEKVKDELLDCLMKEFWDIGNQTLMSNIRTHGSSPESSSPSSENNGSPRKQFSSFTSGKRSLEDGNDEPSERDRERGSKKPKSVLTPPDISDEPPHFACPYRKHDPRKYNVNQWAACALTPQKGVARINLSRTQQELDRHIIAPEGCTVKESDPERPVEGITDRLKEQLQCRKKLYAGQTEAERWQQVYQLLFPNEIVPSPYFEPVRDIEDNTSQNPESLRLEEYLRREVPRMFRILLETAVGNELQTIEEQLKNRLLGLLQEAQNHALMNYHTASRGTIGTLSISPIAEPQYSGLELPVSNGASETSYKPALSRSENLTQSKTPQHHSSFDSGCYSESWGTGSSQRIAADVAGNNTTDASLLGGVWIDMKEHIFKLFSPTTMPDSLVSTLQRVHIGSSLDSATDDFIDSILDEQRPRKRIKQNQEELKRSLEAKYLTPAQSFSSEWLNKLQQRWDTPTDYTTLFKIAPTQTRTITRFTREGLEGRVTGYKEVTVPANSATAKNSTSFLRKPANKADFVRGAAGFFPFAPGGLEGVEAAAALEEQALKAEAISGTIDGKSKLERVINFSGEGGLLSIPPGFKRGLDFEKAKKNQDDIKEAEEVENVLKEEPDEEVTQTPDAANGSGDSGDVSEEDGEDDIDSLLPVEFPALEPHGVLATSSTKRGGREWAHMIDVKRDITNFRELVPDMAREWPFELDTFQKEAVYHLENGDSVFVAAHTSAGKTVVAEYAIALAAKHMTKAIYTSPIKALSNQKFRDFREIFDEVGILTGDVQISPEASCLIMTTEILRSMLYRGADLIRDVEFVIFDEVHYVNDLERGVVWEEVIIMLPEHVTLILLSATVPNTYEFASWVGRTKRKDIYVISTPKRPVPLEHYIWADKGIHKIVDSDKKFIEKGWKDANDILSGRDKTKALPAPDNNSRGGSNARGGRGQNQRGGPQRGGPQRGGNQRGRGGPPRASHNPGHMGRGGRPGGRTSAAQDKTLWVHLVQYLKKETLLPACIFVFSKKRCEENADALSNQDFCTATEKSAIHMIIEKSIARLKHEDRVLPQIVRLRDLLGRGIAVHHGGLLPIVKEVVEMLFAQTLVKVLFATETFAMGLNLPTRTVVFSGYRKHDGHSFRNLLPGEYTQMAGRAGRRGLDTVGSVIIVAPGGGEAPPVTELRTMILGDPSKLRSQFRLTYNMILNLLRVEALKIEEMIKRSFSEHATQQLLPEHEKAVKVSEADLAKVKRDECDVCDVDMDLCHEASQDFRQLTLSLHLGLLATPVGRRMFAPRRLIVYNKEGVRTPGILVREGASTGGSPTVHVLEIKTQRDQRDSTDLLPYLPKFRTMFTKLPQHKKNVYTKTAQVPVADIECLTGTIVKNVIPEIFNGGDGYQKAKEILKGLLSSWELDEWNEMDCDRIKDMQLREILAKRTEQAVIAQKAKSLGCPQFLKHFAMCHDQWLIKENITQLRQLMSDQNLQLLPDYEQRIQVLKDLDFIDDSSRVQLKGKVACEIHSADELVLTELILDNVLASYEPAEIVALLSAFVFQEKTDTVPNLSASLENGMKTIITISEKVNEKQTYHQVILSSDDSNDFVSRPRFGLMEVVYEWARGMSFKNITDLTDVLEGTIVRVITRLDETCREVKNAARIIGDPELFAKMQTCQEMIKRDITAVASLYM
ncbi:hypothetical protein G7Y89_g8854 [Cudoniella acicularis]|uniref:ubiquitinyl hydrolase 1 n=1 Tax=Cudoniella acicularis TaxID=354080 RepID=A0A8H4W0N5_9HELO|nr:hypothetical protein G7Y89_g8854 [Cudoniella acicularis]